VRPWSYKDLPKGTLNLVLFTDTSKGELHGLTVRGLLKMMHIFLYSEQLDEEFKSN
jgi:threonyl-tRNA synthetase